MQELLTKLRATLPPNYDKMLHDALGVSKSTVRYHLCGKSQKCDPKILDAAIELAEVMAERAEKERMERESKITSLYERLAG